MTKKLLTISLLLPLMAASASAFAGSTITDKSYWPNEPGRAHKPGPVAHKAIRIPRSLTTGYRHACIPRQT